jgi:hypothetical protein
MFTGDWPKIDRKYGSSEGLWGVREQSKTGAAPQPGATVSVTLSLTPSLVAVIVAVPIAIGTHNPGVDTSTMPGVEVDHVTSRPMRTVFEASLSVTIGLRMLPT